MLLNEMEIFYYVVELKSFSKAAEKLGISKSHASKKVTQLEQSLKAKLLVRTTRRLRLTEAGKAFYQRCAQVVTEAERGYAQIGDLQQTPNGILRVSAPPALGIYLLAPLFQNYMQQYPEVVIELELENRVIDMIAQSIDVAIRLAELPSSNLVATKLCTIENVLCATPEYLKQHGALTTLDDLQKHKLATYHHTHKAKSLKLFKEKKEIILPVDPSLSCNHLEFIKNMALKNSCVAALPDFMVKQELLGGKLIHCLSDYHFSSNDLYAIFPDREFLPSKVRVFIDMLKKYLQEKGTRA